MKKCMSDYLDEVCGTIRNKSLRIAVRSELSVHIFEAYEEMIQGGMDEDTAAKQAVAGMGDPYQLGKKIIAANRPNRGIATLYGGIALFVIMLSWLPGQKPIIFVDIPTLFGVVGLSAAYGLISCGSKPTLLSFLHHVKPGAIYAGIICTIMGVISILSSVSDIIDSIGAAFGVSLISVFYGVLLSSAVRAVENRLISQKSISLKELLD